MECGEIIHCTESDVLEHLSRHDMSLEDYYEAYMRDAEAFDDSLIDGEMEDEPAQEMDSPEEGSQNYIGDDAMEPEMIRDVSSRKPQKTCKSCDKEFHSQEQLLAHLREAHNFSTVGKYFKKSWSAVTCLICKQFQPESGFQEHLNKVHGTDIVEYTKLLEKPV